MLTVAFLISLTCLFISGNAKSSLINNGSIVLTQSTAQKFFPGQDAIGKKLNYKGYNDVPKYYTVTGVMDFYNSRFGKFMLCFRSCSNPGCKSSNGKPG